MAVALDLEEIEGYHRWVAAGQDPKKFTWSSGDHAGTTTPSIMDKMLSRFANSTKAGIVRGDIYEYADGVLQKVFRAKEFDTDTGKFIRQLWVDEGGKEVKFDEARYKPVESKAPQARLDALKAFGLN